VSEPSRCGWAGSDPLYVDYHDTEWGVPERDPLVLFEFIVLEGAQAGLSWSTILHKREGYRAAFAGFDPVAVAAFTDDDVERCMADAGIVRNRAKITSAIGNARAWLELDDPVEYLWSFVDGAPIDNRFATLGDIPAAEERSAAMSKDLKRRGFRFVGPTICYALMQSCGLVNDHVTTCFRHSEIAAASR
jgi:DNA-3-methyladenine glycosylase I